MDFLPIKKFQDRQIDTIDQDKTSVLMSSMTAIKSSVMDKKKKAIFLKEKGNSSFRLKRFKEAENFYSEAIAVYQGLSTLWTNRAICRNRIGKYEEAISDCEFALLLNRKDFKRKHVCEHATDNVQKAIVQKGNALMGLGKFDAAEQVFGLLRDVGKRATADSYVKKVRDAKIGFHTGTQSTTVADKNVMSTNPDACIRTKLQIENIYQPDQNENESVKKSKSKAKSKKKKPKRKSK